MVRLDFVRTVQKFSRLGKVTWPEYAALYIKFHRMNITGFKDFDDVDFVIDSFDDNRECADEPDERFRLLTSVRRELLTIRYRWMEADTNSDNELNADEFLAFRHPEIAGRSYKYIVDDMILRMGR